MNYVYTNKLRNTICEISITKNHNSDKYMSLIHSIMNKTVYEFTRLLGHSLIYDNIIKYLQLCEVNHNKYCINFQDKYYDCIQNDYDKMKELIEQISIDVSKLPNQHLQSNIEQLKKLTETIEYLKGKVNIK